MKKQFVRLVALICVTAIPPLNVYGNPKELTLCDPVVTNTVAPFVGAIKEIGFSFRPTSFSCSGHIEERDGVIETISRVHLFFERNNDSGISVMFDYSETEFAAASALTRHLRATSSSGRLPPTNSTYRTSFTALSHQDSGIAARHASVLLLSSDMAADIRVGSEKGDASEILNQVISKVELLHKALKEQKVKK